MKMDSIVKPDRRGPDRGDVPINKVIYIKSY